MHIHQESLTTAVAITVGMNLGHHDKVYTWASDNGFGGIELYSEIGQLAKLSYDLMVRVGGCPDFEHESFPGVYAYEVDEEIGRWLADQMRAGTLPFTGGWIAEQPAVKRKLGELATKFFDRAERPIPNADSIIWQVTDYERGANPVAVEVVPTMQIHDEVIAQYGGPDLQTTGWAIYDRLADGTARWHGDEPGERLAMARGKSRAHALGVELAPQAWKKEG